MNNTQRENSRAQLTWVPVRDASGRVHMEARWELRHSTRTHAA